LYMGILFIPSLYGKVFESAKILRN
jgi:hypothetical protein